ncbi:MAG: hypothetical protein DLM57_16150 [Pseudonocardiales bacterium]|nr:MAG: hypothetical protein DLM57_16150 [Pseudonocardiales bacterium]
MTPPRPRDHQRRQAILDQITTLGFCLPGTLTERHTRCSSPGCRCRSDPPALHGPYYSWTRKINGKTVTRTLSPEQAQRYSPWFDDARRLRALSAELEALSLKLAQNAEGWGEK